MRLLGRTGAAAALAAFVLLSTGVLSGALALVTTFGSSMAPRMAADDLVVVRAGNYEIGDVIAYLSPELRQVVLHRIVAEDRGLFVFQGDNNAFLDPERLPPTAIVGKELLHIPRGGIWLGRLTSPPVLAVYTFLLLAGGTAAARSHRHRRKERRTVPARHRSTPTRRLGALHPALQPVAATAAALGLVGVALAGVSWTRPTTAAEPFSVASTLDFSYTAAVPASAAYDSTTVTAPQPVFRALTDTVDVTYAYSGRDGSIAVDAVLSTTGGWTTTLALAPPTPLADGQRGQVRLDLPTLEARADAAAAVTGIPASSLTITVIPRISTAAGEFAPELPLALDALTLKPASDGALRATTTSPETGSGPARLSALGRSAEVATARTASLAAVLTAVAMSLVVLGLARLTGPATEHDRVRARYKDLLLPVRPVALSPGRPVIDVPTIEALATLAQRYGLLVLHWERSGTTTYVVQDEASTYRYRSGGAGEVTAQPASVDVLPVG